MAPTYSNGQEMVSIYLIKIKITTKFFKLKWNQSLDCNVIPWRPLYKSCFYSILDNHYAWFQYRILHRILGVQDLLFKIKISDTNKCRLCGEQKETIIHLFTECRKSVVLWESFYLGYILMLLLELN